jgi:1,2-diacylglycerol 3-beta-galactosyltransferase
MKRILIMMTDAGGGHRASAEALRDVFQQLYGDMFHIDIVDMWQKHTPPPLNRAPKTYSFMVNETPQLYAFVFKSFEKPSVNEPVFDACYRYARRSLYRAFRRYAPDLVISVHALMQEIPLRILADLKMAIPFVTVVTDLAGVHPTWLHPGVTLCFVPTPEVYEMAVQAGLRPEQVRQFGLPIRPAFASQTRSREALRQELGMHRDLPATLLVGGGEGMGPVGKIARTVASRLAAGEPGGRPAGQLVVICGRNRQLQRKMSNHKWPIPTVVQGFVENMPEWMAACDCIITKAGPGTIAEALISGLPLILSGYVAGTEEGNAPYVLQHGVGTYSEDPQEIAETVWQWFGPERAELAGMAERARRLGRPQATFQIVEEIAGLLGVTAAEGAGEG